MNNALLNKRYTIKAFDQKGSRPIELAHPENMSPHPLSFLELPFDPEYSLYNNRMTPEHLNNITPDEQYWAIRRDVILRNTGEFPVQISGKDARKFANYIFAGRNIFNYKVGRCSYQFACYINGGMITDGVLLHLADDKLWMAQADGEIFKWYLAHSKDFEVKISDPNVFVSQIQGPKSMKLLEDLIDDEMPNPWKYFDIATVNICGDPVIITRTGFSNELGWEIYLQPENKIEEIGELIMKKGKKYNIALTGTPVFRARRIEAGLLSAGNDFDKNTNPFQAGLSKFIDFEKGDFIGRDILLKSNKDRLVWGMRVRKGIAKKGRFVFKNSKSIGKICSSTWSPYQECGVCIVRLDEESFFNEKEVEVEGIDGEIYSAQLCSLPMIDKERLIVTGKSNKIPNEPKPWEG